MKKSLFMAGIAAMMVFMGACTGTKEAKQDETANVEPKKEVFTGVLPAADCDGIRYTLHLDYNDEATAGDYSLNEAYLEADTTAADGYKTKEAFDSKGAFTVEDKNGKKVLTLAPAKAEGDSAEVAPVYFVVDTDSTMTMTNADLVLPETPGYTLSLEK